MTMHREHKVKRENQQDATNSIFIINLSISTCFGHHYAHHQENKTVSYCMRCSDWVCRLWLAVVLWSCVVHISLLGPSALIRRCDDLPATITHVTVAAVLVLNTPDNGCLRPKHVE